MTPWVKRLIVANLAVFVAQWILKLPVESWFAFAPSQVLYRPWTPITYMFAHSGFWHIFFNMLMLFFFGPPLEERWGSREFIKYYLICGLGGVGKTQLALEYDPEPPFCLRRLDRDLRYPQDLTGAVHRDGQIWSHALWNLRGAIGKQGLEGIAFAKQRPDGLGHLRLTKTGERIQESPRSGFPVAPSHCHHAEADQEFGIIE